MNIVIGPLETFYIVGAIGLLALSIVIYPTLSSRSKKSHKK